VVLGLFRRVGLAALVVLVVLGAGAAPVRAATGVDVASWQHPNGAPIDWGQVRAAGHDFAFVKADEGPRSNGGSYYNNPYFSADWHGAGAVGLYRGAYHYAHPKLPLSTAVADARHFVSVTGTMQGPLDLPPVLDLEESGGLAPAHVAQWAREWLGEVERLTGRPPIIYTGYYFWRDSVGAPTDFGRNPLWIANWTSAAAPSPIPPSWNTWTFWQYTSTGSSPGIPWTVDLNRFCCPDSHLGLLAGGGNPAFSNPFGSVDGVSRSAGGITISGWTIDPDTTSSIPVHVYVDGAIAGATLAGGARPDVAAAYPGFGAAHGYSFTAPVGPGAHTVCAYAINAGAGNANTQLGCRTLTSDPVGSLDLVAQEPGGAVRVAGWTIDPDSSAPIDVGIFVNGMPWATARADDERPDLAQAGFSSTDHGFSVPLQGLTTAPVDVCVFAINVGPGTHRILGCRTISASRNPFGSFDSAQVAESGVRLRGWAIDPDIAGPTSVHVYVDGTFNRAVSAASTRTDVGNAFPPWGSGHGFDVLLTDVWIGDHQICVFAINQAFGNDNPLLGCKQVRPQGEPFGSVDNLSRTVGGINVSGWAIDPNMVYPSQVRVYVDGHATTLVADRNRFDVGNAFPFYGWWHGFSATIPASPGQHQVCVWALNVAQGMGHRLLTCRGIQV
jgi:GH25 family lysozyme M1 (1,4-beta-N-acetylmuramidase)